MVDADRWGPELLENVAAYWTIECINDLDENASRGQGREREEPTMGTHVADFCRNPSNSDGNCLPTRPSDSRRTTRLRSRHDPSQVNSVISPPRPSTYNPAVSTFPSSSQPYITSPPNQSSLPFTSVPTPSLTHSLAPTKTHLTDDTHQQKIKTPPQHRLNRQSPPNTLPSHPLSQHPPPIKPLSLPQRECHAPYLTS